MSPKDVCEDGMRRLRTIEASLQLFKAEKGRYPTNDEGIQLLVDEKFLMASSAEDPWGGRNTYVLKENENGVSYYELRSLGPDGKEGGGDDITMDGCESSYSPIVSCSRIPGI